MPQRNPSTSISQPKSVKQPPRWPHLRQTRDEHRNKAIRFYETAGLKVTILCQFVGYTHGAVNGWNRTKAIIFTRHERIVCTLVRCKTSVQAYQPAERRERERERKRKKERETNGNWRRDGEILMAWAIGNNGRAKNKKIIPLEPRASSSFSDRFQLWASRA